MSLKERLLKYWFVFSSAALAILYFVLDNRNKKLAKTIADVQTSKLAGKLEELKDRSIQTERDYEKAQKEYDSIKRRHADLFKQLGIGSGKES